MRVLHEGVFEACSGRSSLCVCMSALLSLHAYHAFSTREKKFFQIDSQYSPSIRCLCLRVPVLGFKCNEERL